MALVDLIGPDPDNSTIDRDQIRRATVDGVTRVSIYDVMQYVFAIYQGNHKSTLDKVLSNGLPTGCKIIMWQFPGRGQQKTPVADIKTLLFILNHMTGENSERVRDLCFQLAWSGLSSLHGDLSGIEKSKKRKRAKEGHVYIVRLPQHELTNEPIWKVGMSVQGLDNRGKLRRLRDYGPDAKEYCCIPVENARETERKILDHVRSLDEFESMEEYGSEYFRGDLGFLKGLVEAKSCE